MAPPRLSLLRYEAAAFHAVETSCGTVRPEARTCFFSSATSSAPTLVSETGMTSCHGSVSLGTSGPR
ncbi:Uncharacterised protein [Mycobacteroides abscessus subsp. abscessus]|nr:Uncharacterised protein [Mycobacteroides abscessus subsp. abscessus]